MRKIVPVHLLLLGLVACTNFQAGEESAPPAAEVPANLAAPSGLSPTHANLSSTGVTDSRTAPVAPPLQGTDADGKSFNLAELRGKRVLLIFYRSAYCGLCMQQLQQLATAADAYGHLDARIVALTGDPPELNRRTADLLKLDFPIISVDQNTMTRWGILPTGATQPRPAAFIIDQSGRLRFIQIGKTAADRASDVTLVFALRSLDHPAPRSDAP